MDAAEVKRILGEVTQEDGARERAPAKGAKASRNSMRPVDLAGNRERTPAKGVRLSDISTQLLDSSRGGGNKDTLGSGKGTRE